MRSLLVAKTRAAPQGGAGSKTMQRSGNVRYSHEDADASGSAASIGVSVLTTTLINVGVQEQLLSTFHLNACWTARRRIGYISS